MSLCDDIRELEENLSQYGRLIDEVAKELGCNPDNEKILEAIADLKSRVATNTSDLKSRVATNTSDPTGGPAPAWPNIGDIIWRISGDNKVMGHILNTLDDEYVYDLVFTGNCYRTEEDAKRMAQARADLAALRRAEDTGDGERTEGYRVNVLVDGVVYEITGRRFSTADARGEFVNSLGKNKEERLAAIAEYLFGPK